MYEREKSSLGKQVQRIDGIKLEKALDTQREYALTRGGAPVADKVDRLIRLFADNIVPSSFEHLVAFGEDIGAGLYSFGNFSRDPSTGLYLCYREFVQPFLGHCKDLYMGAYPVPPKYDEILVNGVPDFIGLKGDFRRSDKNGSNDQSKAISILYDELMRQ